MGVVSDICGDAATYRSNMRMSMRVKGAGSTGDLIASSAAGPFNAMQNLSNVAEQYRAAAKGYQFTSIRPIAVKVADQMLRLGVHSPGAMTKRQRGIKTWRKFHNDSDIDCCRPFRHEQMLRKSPLYVKNFRQDVEVIEDHPALAAFLDPNPFMTQWALMYCTAFSMEATGEALWVIDPLPDGLFNIWYIPRTWAEPIHDKGLFAEWKITPPGTTGVNDPIPGELVAHFAYPNPGNPMMAHSGLSAQSLAINTDEEIQRSQFHLVRNMQRPSMMIVLGDMIGPDGKKGGRPELTDKQREEMVQSVRRHYMAATAFGDPMVLDRMVHDVRPYLPALADLDYPNGSKLTKSRIEQGIGVNPIVTGEIEGANRASAWVARDTVVEMKVNPLLCNIGQCLTKKLPIISNERTLVAWFDDAKAKDPELKHKRAELAARAGSMTRDEMRLYASTGELQLAPLDDEAGDELVTASRSGSDISSGTSTGNGASAGEQDDAANQKSLDPLDQLDALTEAIDYGRNLAAV